MKIVCIHQSSDLYGSDRSFLQVIKYLKQSENFNDITIVLPRPGPLANELQKLNIEIKYINLSLLSKTYLKKLQWGKIIFPLLQFRKKLKFFSEFDIVYVNTSVILDLYVLAPFIKRKKIIHIREIPAPFLSKLLSAFISKGDFTVLFNSQSTKEAFKTFKKSHVIHNAFEEFTQINEETGEQHTNELKLLLIGRINTWKGQEFAINALSKLAPHENVKLKIVGSTSQGNEELVDQLKEKVDKLKLTSKVEFVDFISDPKQVYLSTDVVIVPSIKPEPFGRIAIEAMSVKKPVIAANHGGLPEIVSHGENGFLFTPSNEEEFISYVRKYYNNKQLLKEHGNNSWRIFKEKFSIDIMYKNLDKIFKKEDSFTA